MPVYVRQQSGLLNNRRNIPHCCPYHSDYHEPANPKELDENNSYTPNYRSNCQGNIYNSKWIRHRYNPKQSPKKVFEKSWIFPKSTNRRNFQGNWQKENIQSPYRVKHKLRSLIDNYRYRELEEKHGYPEYPDTKLNYSSQRVYPDTIFTRFTQEKCYSKRNILDSSNTMPAYYIGSRGDLSTEFAEEIEDNKPVYCLYKFDKGMPQCRTNTKADDKMVPTKKGLINCSYNDTSQSNLNRQYYSIKEESSVKDSTTTVNMKDCSYKSESQNIIRKGIAKDQRFKSRISKIKTSFEKLKKMSGSRLKRVEDVKTPITSGKYTINQSNKNPFDVKLSFNVNIKGDDKKPKSFHSKSQEIYSILSNYTNNSKKVCVCKQNTLDEGKPNQFRDIETNALTFAVSELTNEQRENDRNISCTTHNTQKVSHLFQNTIYKSGRKPRMKQVQVQTGVASNVTGNCVTRDKALEKMCLPIGSTRRYCPTYNSKKNKYRHCNQPKTVQTKNNSIEHDLNQEVSCSNILKLFDVKRKTSLHDKTFVCNEMQCSSKDTNTGTVLRKRYNHFATNNFFNNKPHSTRVEIEQIPNKGLIKNSYHILDQWCKRKENTTLVDIDRNRGRNSELNPEYTSTNSYSPCNQNANASYEKQRILKNHIPSLLENKCKQYNRSEGTKIKSNRPITTNNEKFNNTALQNYKKRIYNISRYGSPKDPVYTKMCKSNKINLYGRHKVFANESEEIELEKNSNEEVIYPENRETNISIKVPKKYLGIFVMTIMGVLIFYFSILIN